MLVTKVEYHSEFIDRDIALCQKLMHSEVLYLIINCYIVKIVKLYQNITYQFIFYTVLW